MRCAAWWLCGLAGISAVAAQTVAPIPRSRGVLTVVAAPSGVCTSTMQYRRVAGTDQLWHCYDHDSDGTATWNQLTAAPGGAAYLTQTPHASLTAEQALSALSTGLLAVETGTGVVSSYAGAACTNQFVRSLSATGAASCASVALGADVSGSLALASLTDGGATGMTLVSGGGGGDPSWSASPTLTELTTATLSATAGLAVDADNDGTAEVWEYCGRTDADTNGDGTIDYRRVWDYDCDGSLELTDLQTALCGLQGLSVGASGDITTCSGSSSLSGLELVIAPGTYHGNFRQELRVTANDLVIRGAGRDATTIILDAADSGACATAGALDDGDATSEGRQVFLIDGDDVEISGLTIDLTATTAAWTLATGCNRFDWDCDGTQSNNPSSQDCANWATVDTGNAIYYRDNYGLSVHDCRFVNVNRGAIIYDPQGGGAKERGLTIMNNEFDGGGEHMVIAAWKEARVANNQFRRCGSSSCVLVLNAEGATIADNTMRDWVATAIYREHAGCPVACAQSKTVIADNVIINTNAPSPQWNAARVWGVAVMMTADADETNEDVVISSNTIAVEGAPVRIGVSVQGIGTGAATQDASRLTIAGNTILLDPLDASGTTRHSGVAGIYLSAVAQAATADNVVEVVGDGTADTFAGVWLDTVTGSTFAGNSLRLSGAGANTYGLLAYSLSRSDVGPLVVIDHTGSGQTYRGVTLGLSATAEPATDIALHDLTLRTTTAGSAKQGVEIASTVQRVRIADMLCDDLYYCIYSNQDGADEYTWVSNELKVGSTAGFNIRSANAGHIIGQDVSCFGAACSTNYRRAGLFSDTVDYYGWDLYLDADGDGSVDDDIDADGTVDMSLRLWGRTKLGLYGSGPLWFEGATWDSYQAFLAVPDPTADLTWTMPNRTTAIAGGEVAVSADYDLDGTAETFYGGDQNADGTADSISPLAYVTRYVPADAGALANWQFSGACVGTTALQDADPGTSSSCVTACYHGLDTDSNNDGTIDAVGPDSRISAFAGTAANGSYQDQQQLQFGKLRHFALRVYPNHSGATEGRRLIGGYRMSATSATSDADLNEVTDGAFFWSCPRCDVDGDGTAGDANADNDCADAGDDATDCNWWAVTLTNTVWGCLTASTVSTDCDGDATANAKIAGATYTDTGIAATGTTASIYEITWNGTTATFFINGAQEAAHTTNIPSTSRRLNAWGGWFEGFHVTDEFNVVYCESYYLGRKF